MHRVRTSTHWNQAEMIVFWQATGSAWRAPMARSLFAAWVAHHAATSNRRTQDLIPGVLKSGIATRA